MTQFFEGILDDLSLIIKGFREKGITDDFSLLQQSTPLGVYISPNPECIVRYTPYNLPSLKFIENKEKMKSFDFIESLLGREDLTNGLLQFIPEEFQEIKSDEPYVNSMFFLLAPDTFYSYYLRDRDYSIALLSPALEFLYQRQEIPRFEVINVVCDASTDFISILKVHNGIHDGTISVSVDPKDSTILINCAFSIIEEDSLIYSFSIQVPWARDFQWGCLDPKSRMYLLRVYTRLFDSCLAYSDFYQQILAS